MLANLMIELRKITWNDLDFEDISRLYLSSFPEKERQDLTFLNKKTSILGIFSDELIGFMSVVFDREIAHILYFSVCDERRGQGLGSESLRLFIQTFNPSRIMVNIEKPLPTKQNYPERIRRMGFYLKNGFVSSGIEYMWRGENFLVLSWPKSITKKRWSQYWERFHS